MSLFIDKINLKNEEKSFNKVLENELSQLGTYKIEKNGKVVCIIDKIKLDIKFKDKKSYDLKLPSKLFLLLKIKSIYNNFDKNKLKDIEYVFYNTDFDKQVIIDSFSNIIIDNCEFNKGLIIEQAKKVKFSTNDSNNNMINCNNILSISAQELKFKDIILLFFENKDKKNSQINLSAKKISFNSLNFVSDSELNINTDLLNINSSDLWSRKIKINSPKIYEDKNRFSAKETIIIKNINNNEIKNIKAPKIIYNGIEITPLNSAREQLIIKLKELRDQKLAEINKSVESYREDLQKMPLSKELK